MTDCVIVVGAGAAGMAAAIAAARAGSKVLLVERRAAPGGTVVHCLIHTLGGIHDHEGLYLNPGLPQELAQRLLNADPRTRPRKIGRVWTLSTDPAIYGRTVTDWLRDEGVETWTGASVARVHTEGCHIAGVEANDELGVVRRVECTALIDCTGSAEAVRLVDPSLVIDESDRAAAGLVFQLLNVGRDALLFPRNIEILRRLRQAAEEGALPEVCAKTWVDVGVADDEAYVKLSMPVGGFLREGSEFERTRGRALEWRDAVFSYLKTMPDFTSAKLGITGEIGIRDGGRIAGEYILTAEDVRRGRKFPNPAGRCCWPIEYWNPETGVQLEYLPPGSYYEIPIESLKVSGYANLWAAGKCLSAETLARASARVVGCCWAMGEAVGRRAAVGAADSGHANQPGTGIPQESS